MVENWEGVSEILSYRDAEKGGEGAQGRELGGTKAQRHKGTKAQRHKGTK